MEKLINLEGSWMELKEKIKELNSDITECRSYVLWKAGKMNYLKSWLINYIRVRKKLKIRLKVFRRYR